MRALIAAATALAPTACGSTGSSDTSKSTSTVATSTASASSSSETDDQNVITIPAGESVSQDSDVTATWCKARGKVISEIREGVKKAVTEQKKECQIALPEHFTYEVTYKDWKKAYTMSFYPGMQKVDTFTNKLETDRWMDIVTAHCFVVY